MTINCDVKAGPSAVLTPKRESYSKTSFNLRDTSDIFTWKGVLKIVKKNWKVRLYKYYRSLNKRACVTALQKLIRSIQEEDLIVCGSGVCAQACSKDGGQFDDFYIIEDKRIIDVCIITSPTATASLSIGDCISEKVMQLV
jgi:L-2-hydroxyglutarate oxidase